MKIVYFGTDVFLSCFYYFLQYHQILALYTYHNNEDYFAEYSIVNEAKKYGIPVHYEDMTEEVTRKYFLEEGCELFFVAEYNRLLPVPKDLNSFKGINTHASLLPVGRSYYPIEAAMERGLKESGVTMHKLTSNVDSGAILDCRKVDILNDMDSVDVYIKCGSVAEKMLREIMKKLDDYWAGTKEQQNIGDYSYWKRPVEEKLTINHHMTIAKAKECFRLYNQLSQVIIDNSIYYIRALNVGTATIDNDVIIIGRDAILYSVLDGHLRLIVQEKRGVNTEIQKEKN